MQKINLFINHFQCGDLERQKELDYCLNYNRDSGFFASIINFSERPMYSDFFNKTSEYPNDINVFANSDIYFNDTIKNVQGISQNECYALTRWELDGEEVVKFEEKHVYNKEAKARHSQDVWIFNGAVSGVYGDFHIGIAGCDNRIAHEISRRYQISNPSNSIQCIHKHKEESRNYNIPQGYNGRVSPPYKWVEVSQEEIKRKNI